MSQNVFDQSSRRIAVMDAPGFFGWLLTDFDAHLRFNRWLQTRTTPNPGDPEQTGDTVAELLPVGDPAPPWLFPVEFQTEPDPLMFGRMMKQCGDLWMELRPDDNPGSRYQVAVAVVNLTGGTTSAPASRVYVLPTPDGLTTGMKMKERFLATESADATLGRIERGEVSRIILPLIPLMIGGGEAGIIQRWLAAASQEPNERRRGDLGLLALTLADLKDWAALWRNALKGWNVRESSYLNGLKNELKDELKIELKSEEARDNVVRLSKKRFGGVSDSFIQKIQAITDLDVLRGVLEQVYDEKVTKADDLLP
jgi:hypothetical protein